MTRNHHVALQNLKPQDQKTGKPFSFDEYYLLINSWYPPTPPESTGKTKTESNFDHSDNPGVNGRGVLNLTSESKNE